MISNAHMNLKHTQESTEKQGKKEISMRWVRRVMELCLIQFFSLRLVSLRLVSLRLFLHVLV